MPDNPDEGGAAEGRAALLGPVEVRALAGSLGVRPTKTLGQNFVHDANTVRRIVGRAGVRPDDVVVEVGPGLGSLTLALLDAAAAVVAVEIDPVLAGRLPVTVAERAPQRARRLRVVEADALRVVRDDVSFPGSGGAGSAPTLLVANLPYNVAVPVLLHLLAQLPTLRGALVMVQQEVADRLAAAPGGRTYGVPSVKAGYFGTVSLAGSVGRSVFWPVPKVESGLVRIERHRDAPWPLDDDAHRRAVFAVIDAAFAQRRKTLRAALAGWAGGAAEAERRLVAAGIDPSARGERLTTADFVRLAAAAPAA